jgi:nitrous oxidase accessory protein NosD
MNFSRPYYAISVLCAALGLVTSLFAGQLVSVPSAEASTIALAMIKAKAFDTVLVANGVYTGPVMVKADVVLKAQSQFGAVLDGGGKGATVTLGGNATVCGFEVKNGAIGVSSSRAGNAIVKCRITQNRQSGIICVGDVPLIQDNIIVFNKGSGIQGWNLTSTSASINHNTIAYNQNNGIALGGASNVIIEKNIIAFNESAGVKAMEPVKTSMSGNDFYKNGIAPPSLSADNYAADPKFTAPRDNLDFSLQADSPLKSLLPNTEEIGARAPY